jgi:glycine/D-amino acid oxidase-like deaminating enzyme
MPAVITPHGRVRARRVVLAVNAWALALPEVRRLMFALSSHVIVTEPIPRRIAEIGWTGGELLLDGRLLVHYAHVTADQRIAFGRGGGAVAFGDRISGRVLWDAALARTVVADFHRFFPMLRDVRIDAAWGGAVDRAWRHLPFFAPLPDAPDVLVGAGYSGDGVVPSVVGGRILASQALGRDDEWSTCALTTLPAERELPPEPLRKLGGEAVRRVVARKERIEEAGGRPGPLTRAGARLTWLTVPPPPWRHAEASAGRPTHAK